MTIGERIQKKRIIINSLIWKTDFLKKFILFDFWKTEFSVGVQAVFTYKFPAAVVCIEKSLVNIENQHRKTDEFKKIFSTFFNTHDRIVESQHKKWQKNRKQNWKSWNMFRNCKNWPWNKIRNNHFIESRHGKKHYRKKYRNVNRFIDFLLVKKRTNCQNKRNKNRKNAETDVKIVKIRFFIKIPRKRIAVRLGRNQFRINY